MNITYFRYSANGNTFVVIDNQEGGYGHLKNSPETLSFLCRSPEGIGGDGVIFLEHSEKASLKMVYFNADGREVAMCGNGVRSVAHYCRHRKGDKNDIFVETPRAVYKTYCEGEWASIEMADISHKNALNISHLFPAKKSFYVKVGVPHCVFLVDKIKDSFLTTHAPRIRNHEMFPEGTNVNFVTILSQEKKEVLIRTFERGVERETLSCCTGATAGALALSHWINKDECTFHTRGGPMYLTVGNPILVKGKVFEYHRGEIQV